MFSHYISPRAIGKAFITAVTVVSNTVTLFCFEKESAVESCVKEYARTTNVTYVHHDEPRHRKLHEEREFSETIHPHFHMEHQNVDRIAPVVFDNSIRKITECLRRESQPSTSLPSDDELSDISGEYNTHFLLNNGMDHRSSHFSDYQRLPANQSWPTVSQHGTCLETENVAGCDITQPYPPVVSLPMNSAEMAQIAVMTIALATVTIQALSESGISLFRCCRRKPKHQKAKERSDHMPMLR